MESELKAYLWPVDGTPAPAPPSRWRRFIDRHLPSVVIYLMVATLVGVVLYPHMVITVPSGYVGVLWKRFGGGTVLDPRRLKNEGFNLILPWNRVFLYDLRLQSFTESYNAISSDGVNLTATVIVRFRLQRDCGSGAASGDWTRFQEGAGDAGHRQPDARGHRSIHRRTGLFDGAPGNSGQNPQPCGGQAVGKDDGARRRAKSRTASRCARSSSSTTYW